jgi:hypothetical protein
MLTLACQKPEAIALMFKNPPGRYIRAISVKNGHDIRQSFYGRIEYMARRTSKTRTKVFIERCFLPTGEFFLLRIQEPLEFWLLGVAIC